MTVARADFDRAVAIVLAHEGGLADDPRDDGGLTRFGISQRAYPSLDLRSLTVADAVALYRRDYWDRYRCGELPWPLALALFDGVVNQAGIVVVRCLQRALGVAEDGVLGPRTIAAAQEATGRGRALYPVLARFLADRARLYARHPKFAIYGKGWLRRLFLTHQHCLSKEEAGDE